jgi:hypothetical protein
MELLIDGRPADAAALEKERANNAELQEKLDDAESREQGSGSGDEAQKIPCPNGSAGKDFSIQVAMGLAGNTKKYDKYKAIQARPTRHSNFSPNLSCFETCTEKYP